MRETERCDDKRQWVQGEIKGGAGVRNGGCQSRECMASEGEGGLGCW